MVISDLLANRIASHVSKIYGQDFSEGTVNDIYKIIAGSTPVESGRTTLWSEKDIFLITYGDTVISSEKSPLASLKDFLSQYLGEMISCIHILPFFPYSSDDGFSVTDYFTVNPSLGDWADIRSIARDYDLMADLVINHVSKHHPWFSNYLNNTDPGKGFFIAVDPLTDLTAVIRPRSTPLLTGFQTVDGTRHVWTTFSEDQVDLNFRNPEVLKEMIRVFLFYLSQGVSVIRLDAIAFLWKQAGTTCLHLPETHEVVRLLRTIGTAVNPGFLLITETNVPSHENLSYFGKGDQAHMVYQFSLPPLILHSLFSGNAAYLMNWMASLPDPGMNCSFLNFTASHDGIGIRPLEGLLPEEDIRTLLAGMQNSGAMFGYRKNAIGNEKVYEINITYFDALKGTLKGPDNLQVERFLCSQIIMMGLKGIPAFYIHSLLATGNDYEGVARTGMARSINRKKYTREVMDSMLSTDTIHARIFHELKRIIGIRRENPAFHPDSPQQVLRCDPCWVAFKRGFSGPGKDNILCISNISESRQIFLVNNVPEGVVELLDLLEGREIKDLRKGIEFRPYQTMWLKTSYPDPSGQKKTAHGNQSSESRRADKIT